VTDPAVVVAWMLEKACVQQADALMRQIESGLPAASAAADAKPAPATP
jgi:hypothetical protein